MKIAIAGYGVEGQANYTYWTHRYPEAEVTIADQRPIDAPDGVHTIIGEDAFRHLRGFDLVIRTAGLAPRHIVTDGRVWSATNEFLAQCPAPIIGVTGSKGKGTTASLIAAILEADGRKVWLVGNIGIPALDVLSHIASDDIVVYELSSFQLWDVERSPQTAVVLFIEQEHLDVHADMAEYVAAKANITRFQSPTDRLIYWKDNQYAEHIASLSIAQKTNFPDGAAAHLDEGAFWYGEQKICSTDYLKLKGQHNKINALAAIDAVWPLVKDVSSIEKGLTAFTGLPHRLRFVQSVHGVDYYDDSIATTPTSAIVSLQAFPLTQHKVLILGGSYKGSDFSELAQVIAHHGAVDVLLIGDEAHRIKAALDAAQFTHYELLHDQTMPDIVEHAAEKAQPGSVVLLSPAAASFGLFKNYVDRGEQFIAAVAQRGNV